VGKPSEPAMSDTKIWILKRKIRRNQYLKFLALTKVQSALSTLYNPDAQTDVYVQPGTNFSLPDDRKDATRQRLNTLKF
jgi:hypothetical protein